MSDSEAEEVTLQFERWEDRKAKRSFISRMERKLHHKEKLYR